MFSNNNGYYKFPNGLIVQWGNVYNIPLEHPNRKTYFPISFPHKCFSFATTRILDAKSSVENHWIVIKSFDNQGFYIYSDTAGDAIGQTNASWIAIGY